MKKLIVIMLTLVMLTAIFSGCNKEEKTEISSEKTVVTMTSAYNLPAFEKAFEEKYPNIDLEIETMATATINSEVARRLRNNHGSDIIITNLPAGEIANYTYDLSTESFIENYQSTIMNSVSIDGKYYYIPLPGAYYGYIINKSVLDELGLEMPDTKADLLDILAAAKAATTGLAKDIQYGFGLSDAGATFIGAYYTAECATDFLAKTDGLKWLADFASTEKTAQFADSKWEDSIAFVKTCVTNGYMDVNKIISNYNGHMDSNSNAFKAEVNIPNHTALLTYGNIDTYEKIKAAAPEDEIVMLPCLPSDDTGYKLLSAVSNDYMAINKAISNDSNKLNAAKCVLAYLSTEEGQKSWIEDTDCYHSYLNGYTVDTEKLPESIRTYAENGSIFSNPFPTNILSYVGKCLTEAVKGKKTDGSVVTIDSALKSIDKYYQEGSDDVEYDLSVVGSVSKDMIYENANTRKQETAIGNFVADAIREYTNADVALVNGGGIRSSLYAGDVTGDDLSYVCPYGNHIVYAKMTGATLRAALANGIQKTWKPAGQFLQVSGIKYSFIPAKDETETAELVSVIYNGHELQDDEEIVVAYNDFMAGSQGYVDAGDGFTMLNAYDTNTAINVWNIVDTKKTYCDALKEYFAKHKNEAISASIEGRITIVNK